MDDPAAAPASRLDPMPTEHHNRGRTAPTAGSMGLHGVNKVIGLESLSGEALTRIANVFCLVQRQQHAESASSLRPQPSRRGHLEVDCLGGSGRLRLALGRWPSPASPGRPRRRPRPRLAPWVSSPGRLPRRNLGGRQRRGTDVAGGHRRQAPRRELSWRNASRSWPKRQCHLQRVLLPSKAESWLTRPRVVPPPKVQCLDAFAVFCGDRGPKAR